MNNQLEQNIRTIIETIKAIPGVTSVGEEHIDDPEDIAEIKLFVTFSNDDEQVIVYLF